ncbi:hypothetical protein ACFOY8_14340 [Thalassospira xianhensis]|uniref:Uncharacterized protein n=1 Tax=Thalassospira xianhensis MCCC 1A02616 TaxID=1177929 RepID=A0A367UHI0_9PROT|nr:hypothetical protein [Thalassospira xianhensis]RCK07668.1 hypothetical protein TH5_00925 [Thalassospira xianhensis MCCC 1A02616]
MSKSKILVLSGHPEETDPFAKSRDNYVVRFALLELAKLLTKHVPSIWTDEMDYYMGKAVQEEMGSKEPKDCVYIPRMANEPIDEYLQRMFAGNDIGKVVMIGGGQTEYDLGQRILEYPTAPEVIAVAPPGGAAGELAQDERAIVENFEGFCFGIDFRNRVGVPLPDFSALLSATGPSRSRH